MNKYCKSSIFTGAVFLFLIGSIDPILASSTKSARYNIAQSRTIEAKSAQQDTLYLNNDKTYSTDVKDPRDTSAGAIAKDAGIGAAGGLVLGEILGDANVGEAVGAAAAGAAVGNVTADRVVVVKPDESIVLYGN